MHFIIHGILFYLGLVILQLGIFSVIFGLIALVEYLYKMFKEMQRERLQQQRENYLLKNTEKSHLIEEKPITHEVVIGQELLTNENVKNILNERNNVNDNIIIDERIDVF